MAEAIALLGAAAAALQFAELGYKVTTKCSSIVRKYRESPECLQRTHSQIQQLIYLANMAIDKTTDFEAVRPSISQSTAIDNQQPRSLNQHETLAAISIKLESVWKDCFQQAGIIDNILQIMLQEIEGKGIFGKWRKFRLQERLKSIETALSDLERSKTTLGLWLGNESLSQLGRMRHDLAMTHNKMVFSGKTVCLLIK